MFVTDRLVYLQMQKTGCSHIAALLSASVGGEQHPKHSRMPSPDLAVGRTIVGSIRNPWDWYVSLWAYGCSARGNIYDNVSRRRWRRVARTALDEMPASLPRQSVGMALRELRKPVGRWRHALADHNDPRVFRRWVRLMCDTDRKADIGLGWNGAPGQEYGRSSIARLAGLMTFRYVMLHADDPFTIEEQGGFRSYAHLEAFDAEHNVIQEIIHTESLEEDLIAALHRAGHVLDPSTEERIRSAREAKRNTSSHRDAAHYYDAETVEIVRHQERLIIDRYDYDAPEL